MPVGVFKIDQVDTWNPHLQKGDVIVHHGGSCFGFKGVKFEFCSRLPDQVHDRFGIGSGIGLLVNDQVSIPYHIYEDPEAGTVAGG